VFPGPSELWEYNQTYSGEKKAGGCLSFIRLFTYTPPKPKKIDPKELRRKLEESEREAVASGKPTDFHSSFERSMQVSTELYQHPKYEPIKVRFDKDHPQDSVLEPDVLQSDKSELYTSVFLILLGAVLLGGSIMNSYVTAPVVDDPSLSLDAALKQQRRTKH
jgi:hypothetical protein